MSLCFQCRENELTGISLLKIDFYILGNPYLLTDAQQLNAKSPAGFCTEKKNIGKPLSDATEYCSDEVAEPCQLLAIEDVNKLGQVRCSLAPMTRVSYLSMPMISQSAKFLVSFFCYE